MTATRLMDGLHAIPGLVNTHLLRSRDGWALIDTGFARDVPKILNGIRSIGCEPRDVRHILITHAHVDHMGGAAALRAATGADVSAHRLDAPARRDLRTAPAARLGSRAAQSDRGRDPEKAA